MCGASAERAPRRELAPDPSDQGDLAGRAAKPLMLSRFYSCHYITYLVRTNLYLKGIGWQVSRGCPRHGPVSIAGVARSVSRHRRRCRVWRRDAGGRGGENGAL